MQRCTETFANIHGNIVHKAKTELVNSEELESQNSV